MNLRLCICVMCAKYFTENYIVVYILQFNYQFRYLLVLNLFQLYALCGICVSVIQEDSFGRDIRPEVSAIDLLQSEHSERLTHK